MSISSSTTSTTTQGTASTNSTATSAAPAPSVYKYPGDGSLLMPEIPDDEDDDDEHAGLQNIEGPVHTNKRRASVELVKGDDLKRHG